MLTQTDEEPMHAVYATANGSEVIGFVHRDTLISGTPSPFVADAGAWPSKDPMPAEHRRTVYRYLALTEGFDPLTR